MTLDERYTRVIGEAGDITDVHRRKRTAGVGIDEGRVILSVGTAWVSMPGLTARDLGYYLISTAAELEQRQERRS